MSLHEFINNAYTLEPTTCQTHAQAVYFLKEMMKAAGWTVEASGDGVSNYSSSSDVITSTGSGANGIENDDAWVRVVAPDASIEFIFQVIVSGNNGEVRFKHNALGNGGTFTAGSPGISQVPASTSTEHTFLGGGTDAAPTGQGWSFAFQFEAGGRAFGAAETIYPYRLWYTHSNNGHPKSANFCLDALTLADIMDPDPYALWFTTQRVNGGWLMDGVGYSNGADTQFRLDAYIDGVLERCIVVDNADIADSGEPYGLSAVDIQSTVDSYVKGESSMILWIDQITLGSPYTRQFTTENTIRKFIQGGQRLALPWPSGTSILSFTEVTATEPYPILNPSLVTFDATSGIEILAKDAILVKFSASVSNDAVLSNTANYVFSPALEIESIMTSDAPNVTEVLLVVRPLTVEQEYTLTVSNVVDAEGLVMDPTISPVFTGRETKLDKVLTSTPILYDTTSTSMVRQVLTAIHREDDLIGGTKEEEAIEE